MVQTAGFGEGSGTSALYTRLKEEMTSYSTEHASRLAGQIVPDEDSFRLLFDRYYRSIVHFFARRGFPADECHELTQETFLRAYRSLPGFRGESSLKTWLFMIAVNIWRNELRSRQATRRSALEVPLDEVHDADSRFEDEEEGQKRAAPADTEEQTLPSPTQGPLSVLLAEERVRLLARALDDLPPQMRRCMFLRISHDLRYREIAALLGISIETVKSQLFHARQRLKDSLADHFTDIDM